LSFVSRYIAADEKAGGTDCFNRASQLFAVSRSQRILYGKRQIKLSCGEHITAHRARGQSRDTSYFTGQGSVCLVVARNLKSAILLELLDHCISDQNLNAWHKRAILKRGHRNRVDVAQIVWLYRPYVVAKATRNREAADCRK